MSDRVHLRIESDGTPTQTHIFVNGEEFKHVRRIQFDLEANSLATVALDVCCPGIVIDGEFRREVHAFEPVTEEAAS